MNKNLIIATEPGTTGEEFQELVQQIRGLYPTLNVLENIMMIIVSVDGSQMKEARTALKALPHVGAVCKDMKVSGFGSFGPPKKLEE